MIKTSATPASFYFFLSGPGRMPEPPHSELSTPLPVSPA